MKKERGREGDIVRKIKREREREWELERGRELERERVKREMRS